MAIPKVISERFVDRNTVTGERVYPDGNAWQTVTDAERQSIIGLLSQIAETMLAMRVELTGLRKGMIEAGYSTEISTNEATDTPLILGG